MLSERSENRESINQDEDEISLLELVQIFWQKRVMIVVCALLGLAISLGYAFTAKEVWVSTSYIGVPQFSDFQSLMDRKELFFDDNAEN
ncbi:MAG: Wzz/FepE/Etk N-terminal domain-containing protein, partial [Enterobacteriaceae bacterium]